MYISDAWTVGFDDDIVGNGNIPQMREAPVDPKDVSRRVSSNISPIRRSLIISSGIATVQRKELGISRFIAAPHGDCRQLRDIRGPVASHISLSMNFDMRSEEDIESGLLR